MTTRTLSRFTMSTGLSVIVALGLFTSQAIAAADTEAVGNSSSVGYEAYTSTKFVKLSASKGGSDGSNCIEAFFDWQIQGGLHYDARLFRVCDANDSRFKSTWPDDWSGRVVTGINKTGGCVVSGTTSSGGGGTRALPCDFMVGSNLPVNCVVGPSYQSAACFRQKGGVAYWYSGGNPQQPNS